LVSNNPVRGRYQSDNGVHMLRDACGTGRANAGKPAILFLPANNERILDSHRHVVELRKAGIADLNGDRIKACTEHGGVTLVGNSADKHSPQTEEAGLRQSFDHLASHLQGARQIGLAR
jgi:hypothetical protein